MVLDEPTEGMRLADTYAVMDAGRIVDTGPAASLRADDASCLLAV
jgi:ABC-type branched-subunit amino acid transport system ATPase component